MTFHQPVKCKSCGIEFEIPFEPLPIPGYPRRDLLDRFVCGQCGVLTKEGIEFRKEWEDYLDKFR
jgi:hypothetical protein